MVSRETAKEPAIKEQDVLALTAKGNAQLHGAGTSLSPQELEILVLVDGYSTVAQIVRSAHNKPPEAVLEMVGKLHGAGLGGVARHSPSRAIHAGHFFKVKAP